MFIFIKKSLFCGLFIACAIFSMDEPKPTIKTVSLSVQEIDAHIKIINDLMGFFSTISDALPTENDINTSLIQHNKNLHYLLDKHTIYRKEIRETIDKDAAEQNRRREQLMQRLAEVDHRAKESERQTNDLLTETAKTSPYNDVFTYPEITPFPFTTNTEESESDKESEIDGKIDAICKIMSTSLNSQIKNINKKYDKKIQSHNEKRSPSNTSAAKKNKKIKNFNNNSIRYIRNTFIILALFAYPAYIIFLCSVNS